MKTGKIQLALAGNRTPVSRVAGENSTTEPPMRCTLYSGFFNYCNLYYLSPTKPD